MHKQIQERFFDLITSKEPLFKPANNPINTYKELIHYRFKEVILMAFARFTRHLSPKELNDLIEEFIKSKPQTPFIWQMPNEFRRFLHHKQKLHERFAFMDELLWFEWIEIEIFMRSFKKRETTVFNWEKELTLSDSALIKAVEYPVYDESRLSEKGNYYVLLFYNFNTHEVHFQELTEILYSLLRSLEHLTLAQAVMNLSKELEADIKTLQEILEPTLVNFCDQRILY